MRYDQIAALQQTIRDINIRALRERAGLSQKEVARELGVDASTISKWESNPSGCTTEQLRRYLAAIGHLDIVTQPLDMDNVYEAIEEVQLRLLKDASSLPTNTEFQTEFQAPLVRAIQDTFRVPRLAICGSRNAGKSTFINSLLGAAVLPAAYNPLTRSITLIRHSTRRTPNHSSQDCHVWFDKEAIDDVIYGRADSAPISGGYDILDRFVAHRPDRDNSDPAPSIALLYFEAPILLACDLIDLPGLNESVEDSEAAQAALVAGKHGPRAEGVIFCSPAEQFCLQPERIIFATWRNTSGPNRDNFWFAATRARTLQLPVERSIERAIAQLPWALDGTQGLRESTRVNGIPAKPLSGEEVRRHWFPFYQPTPDEIQSLGLDHFTALPRAQARVHEIIYSDLATAKKQSFYRTLNFTFSSMLDMLDARITNLLAMIDDANHARERLASMEDHERSFLQSVKAAREYLSNEYLDRQRQAISDASILMDSYENPQVILKIIENNFTPDEKQEGMANAPSLVSSSIQNDFTASIQSHFLSARTEIAARLKQALVANAAIVGDKPSIGGFADNVTQSLITGGAGALLYVTGHAAVVPAVAALGTAAATWTGIGALAAAGAFAAVAVTVGAIFLIGRAVVKWFQGWRDSLAKDIAKDIREKGLRKKILRSVSDAFDTERSGWFEAIARMEDEFRKSQSELRVLASSREQLASALDATKQLRLSFRTMGWPPEATI